MIPSSRVLCRQSARRLAGRSSLMGRRAFHPAAAPVGLLLTSSPWWNGTSDEFCRYCTKTGELDECDSQNGKWQTLVGLNASDLSLGLLSNS